MFLQQLTCDVISVTLLQRCKMVVQRRDVNATQMQRCCNIVCLLGYRWGEWGLSKQTFKSTIKVETLQLCNLLTIHSHGSIWAHSKAKSLGFHLRSASAAIRDRAPYTHRAAVGGFSPEMS